MWKVAPLKSSFMLMSMLGFLIITVYTAYGSISTDWGFAMGFVFSMMFIASLISMTNATIEEQLELAPELFPKQKKVRPKKKKR